MARARPHAFSVAVYPALLIKLGALIDLNLALFLVAWTRLYNPLCLPVRPLVKLYIFITLSYL